MDDNALKTLVLALERDMVLQPGPERRYACFNTGPGIPDEWASGLVCEQGFRPVYLDLQLRGFDVHPILPQVPGKLAGAFVMAGRARAAGEQALARAWAMLPAGAPILVCGALTDGIRTLRKWASAHAGIEDSFSKHHAVCFLLRRGSTEPFDAPRPEALVSPTMFASSGEDAGSRLLASHFEGRLAGAVADFGAGSGYLAGQARQQAGPTRIDLYEADYLSLERARSALAGAKVETRFFWHDLLREKVDGPYDRVVMNPPFHEGRATRPQIGIGFIETAARALKPGGRLLMVANRNLPYEAVLQARFRRIARLTEEGGFKVIEAIR
ncbi:MAG: class I SAM-dependent methyltransferase [Pseudomonadota bacterium]|nr:class I SAM-dependent methyltransferase [Pseudomonadota bacterium]